MGNRIVLVLTAFLIAVTGCTKPIPPDLEKAVQGIHYFVTPAHMNRSKFFEGRSSMKASEYAEYLFTTTGMSEWPPIEGSRDLTPEEDKSLKAGGLTLFPKDIAIVYAFPDPTKGKQIVISGSNDSMTLFAEAYTNPKEKPVIRRGFMIIPLYRSLEQKQQEQLDQMDVQLDTEK